MECGNRTGNIIINVNTYVTNSCLIYVYMFRIFLMHKREIRNKRKSEGKNNFFLRNSASSTGEIVPLPSESIEL